MLSKANFPLGILLIFVRISSCNIVNELLFDESSSLPRGCSPPPNLFEKYSKMRLPTEQEIVDLEELDFIRSLGIPVEEDLPSDVFTGNIPEWQEKIDMYEKSKAHEEKLKQMQAIKEQKEKEKENLAASKEETMRYFSPKDDKLISKHYLARLLDKHFIWYFFTGASVQQNHCE
jgi:hypothetical protein